MESNRGNSVLVTGSRGFIGRAVTFLLQRSGYDELAQMRVGTVAYTDVTCSQVKKICGIGNP
jgi:nucleoside-diphosphate-sugar epimerase